MYRVAGLLTLTFLLLLLATGDTQPVIGQMKVPKKESKNVCTVQSCTLFVVAYASCTSGSCHFPEDTHNVAWCTYTGDPANDCNIPDTMTLDTCNGTCVDQPFSLCIVSREKCVNVQ